MTRTQSVTLLETAILDLRSYSEEHADMRHRLAILGPASVLVSGLLAARKIGADFVALNHLRTLAASAARALRDTCERHPEIGAADSRAWDVVFALETVADQAQAIVAPVRRAS